MALDYRALLAGREAANARSMQGFNQFQQAMQGMNQSREIDAKEKALGLDVDNMLTTVMLKEASGVPLSPEDMAKKQVALALRNSETRQDIMGNVYPKYAPLGGIFGGAMAPAMQPPAAQAPAPAAQDTPFRKALTAPEGLSPIGMKAFEEEVGKNSAAKQIAEPLKISQFSSAEESLDRLEKINEELKNLGAIKTEADTNLGFGERVLKQLKTSEKGVAVTPTTDPKVAALVDEFNAVRRGLVQPYADATGMTGTQLDREESVKRLMDSFANPTGYYESNKSSIEKTRNTVRNSLGVQGEKKPSGNADPLAAKKAYLEELRRAKAARGSK